MTSFGASVSCPSGRWRLRSGAPRLLAALLLAAAASLQVVAAPPPALAGMGNSYRIVDIGPTNGYEESAGLAVNDASIVAGYTFTQGLATHAIRYKLGVTTTLSADYSVPLDINESGTMVGYVQPLRAKRWDANGFISDLGTLGGGRAIANAINDSGVAVGWADVNTETQHAFRQAGNLPMTDLNSLKKTGQTEIVLTEARGINDAGTIVGDSSTVNGERAFMLTSAGNVYSLGALPGATFSYATDVNILGHAVGSSGRSGFIYNGKGLTNLGTLAAYSDSDVDAQAINDRDEVVGTVTAYPSYASRAFLWRNGAMYDLNSFLPGDSGWTLTAANDISNLGVIAGVGLHGGKNHAFMLVPMLGGSSYHPLTTRRILDTRSGLGMHGRFSAGATRHLAVSWPGSIVKPEAIAVTGILTVVDPTVAGYVEVGPALYVPGQTSVVNFEPGEVRRAGVTVQLAANGGIDIYLGPAGSGTAHVLFDVTGYFTVSNASPYARFAPIDATRLVDTRTGNGGHLVPDAVRTFSLATATSPVPSTATAVFVNVTVANATAGGYVELSSVSGGSGLATITFEAGQITSNGVTLKLAAGAKLYAVLRAQAGSTDLILDVTGYYAPSSDLLFYPVPPTRMLDSRIDLGIAGPIPARAVRTLPLVVANGWVPAGAKAVSGTAVAVGPTALGYLSVAGALSWPPSVSTLNFGAGDICANDVAVKLDANGRIQLVYGAAAGSSTEAVFDLTGYYK